ncbi:MAG: NAD(P)H-hydrate dehydratase [Deltaproteobacteria bacterium]|nr:NAD(P)H-hydrate dehydratase [Deltaproteobacteria bacterium]
MNWAASPLAARLPSQAEMAAMDEATISAGVAALELMERAGRGVYETLALDLKTIETARISILCGPGNNGGDGLVVARYLREAGAEVKVVLSAARRFSPALDAQLDKFVAGGGSVHVFGQGMEGRSLAPIVTHELADLFKHSDLIVDALLGTGQKQAPRGSIAALVELLRASLSDTGSARVVAIDIPTGINADSGEVYDPCVRADQTISIELIKRGLLQYPAREYCGELKTVPIGINCEGQCEFELLTASALTLPVPRRPDAHKGEFGHVLVVGGSSRMPGAAALCAISALRAGAGLVTKTEFGSCFFPEIMLEPVEHCGLGYLGLEAANQLIERASHATVLVLGPGMGRAPETGELLLRLLSECLLPTVLDADGLNLLASSGSRLTSLKHVILTPHPGEAARLLGETTAEVQRDRYSAAARIAKQTSALVVLKGASSIVHDGTRGFVNPTGNPYMATAGSGDVLAGILAGLLAQRMSALEAAKTAVFLHGRAGDLAHAASKGNIIAGDIISYLGAAFESLRIESGGLS